ncbi:MAG: class I SAM-dependent methyltransferase [Dehalococcoidia bacterium]
MNRHGSLQETRAFFASRAPGWESRYPDDTPQYERAVRELAPPFAGHALDLGCGSGRALPILRNAVGPRGRVIGIDATDEMLAEATRLGRHEHAALLLGGAADLPLAGASIDVIFAAGLLPHLPDPVAGLSELARVTRPGARLAIFHPIGRVALAARHGNVPSDDDAIAPQRLRGLLKQAGWTLESIDDAADRYLALAVRRA